MFAPHCGFAHLEQHAAVNHVGVFEARPARPQHRHLARSPCTRAACTTPVAAAALMAHRSERCSWAPPAHLPTRRGIRKRPARGCSSLQRHDRWGGQMRAHGQVELPVALGCAWPRNTTTRPCAAMRCTQRWRACWLTSLGAPGRAVPLHLHPGRTPGHEQVQRRQHAWRASNPPLVPLPCSAAAPAAAAGVPPLAALDDGRRGGRRRKS